MAMCVCGGAALTCSFGMAPGNLIVTSEKKVMAAQPFAAIKDQVPMKNITPFGMCSSMSNPQVASATSAAMGVLTPMPCMPVLSSPWTPGSSKLLIGNQPALTDASQLMCTWGGIIQITNPGTGKHQCT